MSSRQILWACFGHSADFRNCCFILPGLPVSSSNAKIRAEHRCPARMGRENLFRGLLFCDCCGHPLTLLRKKLIESSKIHVVLSAKFRIHHIPFVISLQISIDRTIIFTRNHFQHCIEIIILMFPF